MKSFGDILKQNGGLGPGFDFARIFLAMCVLAYHVPETAYGFQTDTTRTDLFWPLHHSILPMFFGLSGFLVSASAQRLTLKNFALNRLIRIFPALVVEILLSAFILGPLLTKYDISSYFSNREFWAYLENMAGLIHYRLPGVFHDAPFAFVVNASLWTVPYEIACYLTLGLLIFSGLVRQVNVLIGSAVLLIVLTATAQIIVGHYPDTLSSRAFDFYLHGGLGPMLVPCFLLGAAAYQIRYWIAYDWRLFVGLLTILLVIGATSSVEIWEFTPIAFLICPIMIYLVCFIGLSRIPKIPFYSRGDYSYGIYLYGFPLQQALIQVFPSLHFWPYHLAASVCCATAFAAFSWHTIEKPMLKLRKAFSFARRLEQERQAAN